MIVRDHLDCSYQDDGAWGIGEPLVFVNYTDLDNEDNIIPNVFGIITDIISNSAVFYGIIQDGEIILYRGGLWHFNEGNGSLAYDALGYNSPGVIEGSEWVAGFVGTNLEFNGYTDKVIVKDSNSLDIKDYISIEAWMKPSNNVLLYEIELDAAFGYNPNIINVDDNIYAVVYQGTNDDGYLKTIEISEDGAINQTEKDAWIFDVGKAFEPRIIHISDDIYVIVYVDTLLNGVLKTVQISPNGTITTPMIDMFVFDTNTINEPEIVHVSGDIYALTYGDKTFCQLMTVQIASDGTINGSIDTITYDSAKGEDPEIIHVSDDIYAIAYIKNPNQVTVRTVEILSNGTILTSPSIYIDELMINNDGADDPNILHVSGDVYAVAYSYHLENFGEVATFEIASNGIISNVIDRVLFDDQKCMDPNIIHHTDDVYLIAYTSTTPHVGEVVSIQIESDGQISDQVTDEYIYATDQGYEPNIIRVNGDIYAIAYRGWSPHTGYVGTINPSIGGPVSNRGISKSGAYGLYANMTHAFGTINDKTISAKTSGGWIHIILTYDGSYIRLYSNSKLLESEPYTGEINRNSNDLYFGVFFNGQIDEVAIYDRVLSPTEILTRYNNQKP